MKCVWCVALRDLSDGPSSHAAYSTLVTFWFITLSIQG